MSEQRDRVLAGLTGFQQDAVAHVIRRFFRDATPTRRFLVADETGLGKSVVARGVIAETIDELQHDASVDRIDVVYVCSNSDLARQNLVRLNVTGSDDIAFTSRLTLLALQSGRLTGTAPASGKRVNLISFTPSTSFDMKGWRTGSKEERALLHALLTDHPDFDPALEHASLCFFRGTVSTPERLAEIVTWTREQLARADDHTIAEDFRARVTATGLLQRYRDLLDAIDGPDLTPETWRATRDVTGLLRTELAKASVAALEPDLVILDEFQRFRHLLDPQSGEAAKIAHHLFDHAAARVLLLSATPYKPFTRSTDAGEDDHFADLVATLQFLAGSAAGALPLLDRFAAYRAAILSGTGAAEEATALRQALLQVMSRNERPVSRTVREVLPAQLLPTTEDVLGYQRLQQLAEVLDVAIPLEYWKSIPYFGSFLDGYGVERALRRAVADPSTADSARAALAALTAIDEDRIRESEPLDPGSGPLRELAAQTVGAGLWKLLWLPASMPYLVPEGAYRDLDALAITKRVVFSAWSATPVAVSTILSYEADRMAVRGSRLDGSNTPETRRTIRTRLAWAMEGPRAAAMSTLALFWPHPALAPLADPLRIARAQQTVAPQESAEHAAALALDCGGDEGQPWESYFRRPDGMRGTASIRTISEAVAGGSAEDPESDDAPGGLGEHVKVARDMLGDPGPEDHEDVALLALHGPGNIAWRALGRLRHQGDAVTEIGLWTASAIVSSALRSLFGRVESMLLLDQLYGADDGVYWRRVLRYCADGNLQAVLDEQAFQLDSDRGGSPLTDDALTAIAQRMASATSLRPATYRVRDTKSEGSTFAMSTRFATQYGGTRQDADAARQPEVRNAFNSPFPPFVLASTSVGQEGIDFHWWSHAVVHWNLPPNPVDFEQREGRVDRYGGHAVRKNVAAEHWKDVLASEDPNPWRIAFDAARDTRPDLGEFAPHWLYPGPAAIERHVPLYPLSRDHDRYQRLKKDMTLYRLTLGQPRQEDMLALLESRGVDADAVVALDLRPPGDRPRAGRSTDERSTED